MAHTFHLAPGRQTFEFNTIEHYYRVNSKTTRAKQRRLVLKQQQQQNEQTKKSYYYQISLENSHKHSRNLENSDLIFIYDVK